LHPGLGERSPGLLRFSPNVFAIFAAW
jgi:hypothetical protein